MKKSKMKNRNVKKIIITIIMNKRTIYKNSNNKKKKENENKTKNEYQIHLLIKVILKIMITKGP